MNANSEVEYHFFDTQGNYRRFRIIEGNKAHVVNKYENRSIWRLWYIMMETRSEGLHGELFNSDNKSIIGKEKGEKMVVQNTIFIWKGFFEDRKNLFDQSGWIPENFEEYYPSKKLVARVTEGKRAQ